MTNYSDHVANDDDDVHCDDDEVNNQDDVNVNIRSDDLCKNHLVASEPM